MEPSRKSLDELFNPQVRYVVPMFQRLYVWKENFQWQNLWDDIEEKAEYQLSQRKSHPHYLGALIIEGVRPVSGGEVKRFLVIDGQQRLTTLQLIVCAYRDLAREQGWTVLDRRTTRFLENADLDVMENPEEEKFKLWPTTLNRQIFSDIVSAGSLKSVESAYPLIRLPRKRKPELRSNLVEAYLYFSRRLRSWVSSAANAHAKKEEDCAFALMQALQQDFFAIQLSLSESDDSQEIFYSLNSQATPLSQSDLLRSLIFMRAEKQKPRQDRDQIFKDYWSRFETPFWSFETGRGGHTYSRLDLGLRHFLAAKTGALVDARRVNEEYRQWISVEPLRYATVRDELHDLTAHCLVFERYETFVPGLPSTDFRRLLKDFDVSTAMPLIVFLEIGAGLTKQQLEECLWVLESFIVRRAFVGDETKEYNKLFVEVVGALLNLEGTAIKPALEQKLLSGSGTTRNWPKDAEVVEAAITRKAYNPVRTHALKVILERLELSLRGKKSEDKTIGDGLQIEHILPEKWAQHWPLQGKMIPAHLITAPFMATDEFEPLEDSIRERNDKLQTLGNLTLLNKYLNPAAGNGSWAMKQTEYVNSVLQLNRHFDGLVAWDETHIRERGRTLGETICKIWPRPNPDAAIN